MTRVITIACRNGRCKVRPVIAIRGLAVTPWIRPGDIPDETLYSITHTRSGHKLNPFPLGRETAERLLAAMLALPIDWKKGINRLSDAEIDKAKAAMNILLNKEHGDAKRANLG